MPPSPHMASLPPSNALALKKAKPPFFMGKDTSLTTVNGWIFKIHSYVRSSNDDEEKVKTAASSLMETAEQWFMAKYMTAIALPTFNAFVQKFKMRFTHADDSRQLHLRIESITLGSHIILEYHAEVQTHLCQLGEDGVHKDWAHMHFKLGLPCNIQ